MVSFTVCFSKYLSDEPMVSRGVPGPGFPTWYWLWRGNFWARWLETAGKLETQYFLGKALGEQGKINQFLG